MSIESPVNQDAQVTVSSLNVEDIVEHMARTINDSISKIEEIQRTNPKVEFELSRDKNNHLVLLAHVTFPQDSTTISPMEYTERIVAADMVKALVAKQMGV